MAGVIGASSYVALMWVIAAEAESSTEVDLSAALGAGGADVAPLSDDGLDLSGGATPPPDAADGVTGGIATDAESVATDAGGADQPTDGTPPADTTPMTEAPAETAPPETAPPETAPPETQPPATPAPTQAPATTAATAPASTTQPATTQPPTTQAPTTQATTTTTVSGGT
jgi:outer membrane biosynthesis protein TonB